jgi:TrmH family RNA methyltransferase
VLFGDERRGLSPEEQAICTQMSRIPIVGHADSLNVGVAAGVILFEVLRRAKG